MTDTPAGCPLITATDLNLLLQGADLLNHGLLVLPLELHGIAFTLELRQFPLGKHDDGPDALEMAIQAARIIDHRQSRWYEEGP